MTSSDLIKVRQPRLDNKSADLLAKWNLAFMLCKCHWIVLYTVHFTAFCLGGPFFPGHDVLACSIILHLIVTSLEFDCTIYLLTLHYFKDRQITATGKCATLI